MNARLVYRALSALTNERQSTGEVARQMVVASTKAYNALTWMVDAGLANAHGSNEWTRGPEVQCAKTERARIVAIAREMAVEYDKATGEGLDNAANALKWARGAAARDALLALVGRIDP